MLALNIFLFLFVEVDVVKAADESFAEQFLGSPLLVLAALIIIGVIAFIYRKLKK